MSVRWTRCSFTMIEMLVVLTVLLLLIMLSVTSLVRARARGRDVQCRNNLRNLQVAVMNHLFENGRLPYARSFEGYDPTYRPDFWYERNGWIAWRGWTNHQNDSSDWSVRRPGKPDLWWGEIGRTSITGLNSALWPHTGRNIRMYLCPAFGQSSVMGSMAPDGTILNRGNPPLRSYGMNPLIGGIGLMDFGRTNASRRLLFADLHTHAVHQAPARSGAGMVRICRHGLLENIPSAPGSYYVSTSNALFGYVEPCSYDAVLTGIADPEADPPGAYPVESVGLYHGVREINGVMHPVGHAIFIDGHIESLTWWQTTNACSGNW